MKMVFAEQSLQLSREIKRLFFFFWDQVCVLYVKAVFGNKAAAFESVRTRRVNESAVT